MKDLLASCAAARAISTPPPCPSATPPLAPMPEGPGAAGREDDGPGPAPRTEGKTVRAA